MIDPDERVKRLKLRVDRVTVFPLRHGSSVTGAWHGDGAVRTRGHDGAGLVVTARDREGDDARGSRDGRAGQRTPRLRERRGLCLIA